STQQKFDLFNKAFVKRKYLVDKIFHAGFKGITTSEPGLW
ncbi:hypothetical protein ACVS6P_005501, partial [Klebsiella pneumoniae]